MAVYYVNDGETSTGLALSFGCSMHVFSGGTANSTTVNDSSGYMHVSSGGTANSTTVNHGRLYVSSGGTANSTTVNSSGGMFIHAGGTANDTTVNGGSMNVTYGAIADNATVNAGGNMVVFSGGTANSTIVNSGGWMCVSEGGTATSVTISAGGRLGGFSWRENRSWDTIENGSAVVADHVLIVGNSMIVSEGGTADNTTVNGGSMVVSEGGTADNTTVSDGGRMYVFSGGTADNTTVNYAGYLYVLSGGTAENTTVNAYGDLTVSDGGTANSTTVNSSGYLSVSSGGTASNTAISYGRMYVSSGGTANSTTVNWGGSLTVSGGTANSTTVNSAGALAVLKGGTANSTTVYSGGSLTVSNGGTASLVFTPWQGTVTSAAGAVVTYLEREANIYYGGSADGVISKGDVFSGLAVEAGKSAIVYSNGTAGSTTVNFSGNLHVSGGGTARDVTINDFGSVCVYSGGRITGRLNNNGAAVSAFNGAEINFDLTSRTTSDAALVSHISLIQGMPDYTITVSSTQSTGAYTLAGGAYGFNGTFSLGTAESQYGTITVNGESFIYEDRTYVLETSGGNLILTITDGEFRLPSVISTAASTELLTNQDVTVSAVFSGNTTTGQYSLDNQTWQTYTSGVVMSQNGTVYFRAANMIGYSQVICRDVTNIDKVPPHAPIASADITAVTNQNVTVTATFSNDSPQRQYSLDNRTWRAYNISGVVMSQNGTVYFRGIDTAGNISEVTRCEVTNIDKTAPTKPTVKASTTAVTNQNVKLTATFSADSVQKQYSTDNATWNTYSSPVAVAANGTYYFRGIDSVGNISSVTSYKVTNIDKAAPSKPKVTASTTAATNKNITLTATFSADSAKKQYSLDNETWKTYSSALTVEANATYYFRGIDAAGNISSVTTYRVTNIDKAAPDKPTVAANTTAATNKNVTLTATFSEDSAKKQYSQDKTTWMTYSKALTVTANGTYYFRGIDAAGNISSVATYKVSNIDKAAPDMPTVTASTTAATNKNIKLTATFSADSARKQYSLDNETWKSYSTAVAVAANGTYYFRGIDAAGNISDVAIYKVKNIDKTAPSKPKATASTTEVTNKDVTVTAVFSADSAKKQYSLDNETWSGYKDAGVTLTQNGTVYFRGIDAAGNISKVSYLKVKNIDKTAPAAPTVKASTTSPTNQNVKLTVKFSSDTVEKQYSLDNKTWKTYTKALTAKDNGTYYFRGTDAAGNISAVKKYKVTNIDKIAPAKPTIASISTTAMTNKSVTVKVDFSSDSSLKQYSLDNETWKIYKDAGITLKENGTVYFRGVDAVGNISKVLTQKVSNICPKGDFTNDTLEAAGAKNALNLSSAQKITGWVGLGDPTDFIKLEVQKKGQVSLDMNAATAKAQNGGEVKLSLLNSAGKAVALSALDSDTLATKSKVSAGIYYLGVTCADVNKYSTSYNVKAGMLAS